MAKAKKSKTKKSKAKKSKGKKTKKAKSRAASRGKAKKSKARKAKKAPRKAAKPKAKAKAAKKVASRKKKQIVGEGDYQASRSFLKDESNFVRRHSAEIPAMGKEAEAALDGLEGNQLRAAEEEAKSHSKALGE